MFETARLRFSITAEKDAEELRACLNDPLMAQWISFIRHPYTKEHAAAWVRRAAEGQKTGTEWLFSARLREGGAYVGSVNLHKTRDGEAEAGYWVSRLFQGGGYASEMLQGIMCHAFEDMNLDQLFSTAAPGNIPSQRMLQKAGFQDKGMITVETTEGQRSSNLFRISKKDYQTASSRSRRL